MCGGSVENTGNPLVFSRTDYSQIPIVLTTHGLLFYIIPDNFLIIIIDTIISALKLSMYLCYHKVLATDTILEVTVHLQK